MQYRLNKILIVIGLALTACSDQPIVIYDPGTDAEEQPSGQAPTSGPSGYSEDGRLPDGPIPITRNPSEELNAQTSNGSGGPTGYHVITFGNGAYKIDVPNDSGPSKAYGLHIHLHGDGGGGYQDFPNRQTVHDLIGVTVRAPMTGQLQWGRTRGIEHATYLHNLIQNELLKKYNIRTDRIYFSGVSGGAYFLTGHFIPRHGHIYRTGALLLCGGMIPSVQVQDIPALKDFRMHYIVTSGERGDISTSIRASLAAYRTHYQTAGAPNMLTNATEGTAGHCVFDNISYTSGIQKAINERFATVVKN